MARTTDLEQVYNRLFAWCERRGFAGWDPFDGLNSRVFQMSPFRGSSFARWGFSQAVKRSPVNVRSLLSVPKTVNAKGIALFALAEISRFRETGASDHEEKAKDLLDRLLDMGIREEGTLAYGYNFDWQSRNFFAQKGTPTIVPTAFASQAFDEAFQAFGDELYREAVDEIAVFVATALKRPVETDEEVCFSYTPGDNSVIHNASLLAAECLARSPSDENRWLVVKALNFTLGRQHENGSWSYGEGASQSWVDNFHTAYVLLSLRRLSEVVPPGELNIDINDAFHRGKAYWTDNFFLEDGTPKYYDNMTNPIDIHSAAVAIAAAAELGENDLAESVAAWTIRNMRDSEGFFYYRVGKVLVDNSAYMRWGQAWMAYALARLIESR
jgi:hypothetical protein